MEFIVRELLLYYSRDSLWIVDIRKFDKGETQQNKPHSDAQNLLNT